MKVKEPVLDELFGTIDQWHNSPQSPTVIPLYIPFLVHRRLLSHMAISFKVTCRELGIPSCETEYENWGQWLAGSSSIAATLKISPHEVQSDRGSNPSDEAPTETSTEPIEISSEQNSTETELPNGIPEISLDSCDERSRDQPRDFDAYPGNFVGLELYAVELLRPLENYIAIPLSKTSLTTSHFAYLHIMNGHSVEPEGQHDWLECYEKLANEICQDLVGGSLLYLGMALLILTADGL